MGLRKKKKEAPSKQDLVQVMTVSLFIILLAFFILLNSIAVIDEERRLAAWGSLLHNFGILSGGPSMIESELKNIIPARFANAVAPIDFTDLVTRAERMNRDIEFKTVRGRRTVRIPLEFLYDREGMNIRSDHIMIRKDLKKCVLIVPSDALFDRFDTSVKHLSQPVLDKLCRVIRKNNVPVEIVAHTDNMPPDGLTGRTNREISALQALEILKYCINSGGIDPKRLTAFGKGEYQPECDNSTKETRKMNRRVEFVFRYWKSTPPPRGFFRFKNFFFKTSP